MIFLALGIHIAKGIFSSSYRMTRTYFIGIVIFLLTALVAFLGYVLLYSQMSY